MRKHNGTQLYGIQKILTTLKMGMNKELRNLSIKQKLAIKVFQDEGFFIGNDEKQEIMDRDLALFFLFEKMAALLLLCDLLPGCAISYAVDCSGTIVRNQKGAVF